MIPADALLPSRSSSATLRRAIGEKVYDRVSNFSELSELLNGTLEEYNETNAAMDLVLFEDAMKHVCRISRIIEASGATPCWWVSVVRVSSRSRSSPRTCAA